MELSIREAKARFSEAAAAAASGERVVVTKQGQPFIELVPAQKRAGIDWEKFARIREELGIEGADVPEWPERFDDPVFSRKVLGLEE